MIYYPDEQDVRIGDKVEEIGRGIRGTVTAINEYQLNPIEVTDDDDNCVDQVGPEVLTLLERKQG